MDKIKAFKWVAATVCGLGADSVVSAVITNNMTATTTVQKVLFYAGRIGIGSLVGVTVAKHIEKEIDELVDNYNEAKLAAAEETPKK